MKMMEILMVISYLPFQAFNLKKMLNLKDNNLLISDRFYHHCTILNACLT